IGISLLHNRDIDPKEKQSLPEGDQLKAPMAAKTEITTKADPETTPVFQSTINNQQSTKHRKSYSSKTSIKQENISDNKQVKYPLLSSSTNQAVWIADEIRKLNMAPLTKEAKRLKMA